MRGIDELYDALSALGVMFFNYATVSTPAVAMQDRYASAIFVNERIVRTTAQEKVMVAHEAGHLMTGALHPFGASKENIARDEYRADKYAVHELLSPEEIREAVKDGVVEYWELSERFDLPEDFIEKAVYIYRCEGEL